MRNPMRWLAIPALMALTCLAAAQEEGTETTPPPPAEAKVTLDVSETPIADVLRSISQNTGVTILTSGLPDAKLTLGIKELPISTALNVICKSKGLTWRRMLVLEERNHPLEAEKLLEIARGLAAMEAAGVMITDPESGASTLYLRSLSSDSKLDAMPFSKEAAKEVFLGLGKAQGEPTVITGDRKAVTAPTPRKTPSAPGGPISGADSTGARTSDGRPLLKQQEYAGQESAAMGLFQSMTPAQRKDAVKMNLQLFQQMSPEAKAELARMGLMMYYSTDPRTRNKVMKQVRKEMGIPSSSAPARPKPAAPRAPTVRPMSPPTPGAPVWGKPINPRKLPKVRFPKN